MNQFIQYRFFRDNAFEKNYPRPTIINSNNETVSVTEINKYIEEGDEFRIYNLTLGTPKLNNEEGVKDDEYLKDMLVKGNLISLLSPNIKRLGIQTLPGIKFYVNNRPDPIIVDYSGLYEIDLDDKTIISHLAFSASSIDRINETPGGYLFIDVLYDKEGFEL